MCIYYLQVCQSKSTVSSLGNTIYDASIIRYAIFLNSLVTWLFLFISVIDLFIYGMCQESNLNQ